MRRLPPLSALRAFEAAARHMSFTRAADELGVTPAAVSQQIRSLEDWLGTPLFRRLTRALRLTEAAQSVLPQLSEAFDILAGVTARLEADEDAPVLVVSAAPTFATKWLVPRLAHFNDAYPDIAIRIDASLGLVGDFDRDGVHVAVRLGGGDYPGMRVDKLVDEDVAPACSPALLAENHPHPLKTPDDLRHHRLIHVDWGPVLEPPTWKTWCDVAGVEGVDTDKGPIFSVEDLAISAAMAGQGVVLVSTLAAQDDLAAGRLVRPFDIVIPSNSAFWVVAPERTADRPKVAAFREWLFEEIKHPGPLNA
jgi:LysR family glycine cleavage system transcriptional activator